MAKPKNAPMMEKEDVRPSHTTPQASVATHVHEHEHSDVDIRAIIRYAMILLGSLVVVQVILWGVFRLLEGRAERADAAVAVTSVSPMMDTGWTWRGPQLQAHPVADLVEFKHREDSVIQTYGWVDKGTGIVHIPIDRAIDIVAERGLLSRPEGYEPEPASLEQNGGQVHMRTGSVPMPLPTPATTPDSAMREQSADSAGTHR